MELTTSQNVITFSDEDVKEIQTLNNDVVVIFMIIAKHNVKTIIVGNGNSADLLFYDAFQQIKLPLDRLKKIYTPFIGFNRSSIIMEREISLLVIVGRSLRQVII